MRYNNSKGIDMHKLMMVMDEISEDLAIVEGKKDKKALKAFGLNNIIAINNKPLIEIADKIKNKGKSQAVILTDFDSKGMELAARLEVLLKRYKIKVNNRLRCKVMKFGRTRIEDFNKLVRGDCHVKVSSNFNEIYNKSSYKGKGSSRET